MSGEHGGDGGGGRALRPHRLLSKQKRLQESVELLDRFKQGTLPAGVTDAQVN